MLLSPEKLKQSSMMEETITEFIRAYPSPPTEWSDYHSIRAVMDAVALQGASQVAGVTETYRHITLRDGAANKIKVFTPDHPPSEGSPLIILNFGGGFIAGSCEQMTVNARCFVKAFGAVVVNPDYRLAPDHPWPTQQLDVWDTTRWCADNAKEVLKADPTKGFIIGGVSAGGNVSSVVATMAVEQPLRHPITGQWLAVPTLMNEDNVPDKYRQYYLSMEHNTDTPVLAARDLDIIQGFINADASSPLRYPVLTKAPLSRQPKAFIQACGLDPIRDDALVWDEMLKEAGVQTRTELYPGCPHAHWSFMPGLDITTKARVDTVVGMAWLLGKEMSRDEALKAIA
ncbi:alpha/beta-hydrolase [Polychaeton citri CBS 116435]|uniref:Alpha/beta-hydrolase n=1 Tax=Polychaeton citri CBS 116435 TaxID=1314669 RepID=A0A9P4Q9J8_9PEZI|nr:alpha/beta-hydrolase [Polychaeton citri CBS 116435]